MYSIFRSQIADPLVLLDPVCLGETLLEWLPVLERILGPEELQPAPAAAAAGPSNVEERREQDHLTQTQEAFCSSGEPTEGVSEEKAEPPELGAEEGQCESQLTSRPNEKLAVISNGTPPEPVRVGSPKPVPSDLLADLTQLATLYAELSCFGKQAERRDDRAVPCTTFLRRYFFLLDGERVRRMCLLCYREQPEVQRSFMEAVLGQKSPRIHLRDGTRSTFV